MRWRDFREYTFIQKEMKILVNAFDEIMEHFDIVTKYSHECLDMMTGVNN